MYNGRGASGSSSVPGRRRAGAFGRSVNPSLLAACRDLLRHWEHPLRLLENPLLRELITRGLDINIPEQLRQALSDLIQALPARQQMIFNRCDLLHEVHSVVYRSANLSRRQFYRERVAGMQAIAMRLVDKGRASVAVNRVVDPMALELSRTEALEQTGHRDEAVETLEQLLTGHPPPVARTVVLLRLIQLHARSGRLFLAASYLRSARDLPPGDAALFAPVIDVSEAEVCLAASQDERAVSLLRKALPELRRRAASRHETWFAEALLAGLLIDADLFVERGDFQRYLASVAEARSRVSALASPNRVISHEVRLAVAAAQTFDEPGQPTAESALWACFEQATSQGLPRQAVVVASCLARYYSRSHRPDRALNVAQETLATARVVAPGAPLGLLLLEASEAAYSVGDRRVAARYINEARQLAACPRLSVYVDLAAAHLLLADGHPRDALRLAESVETNLASMQRPRYAASALRLQAEALAELGERSRALRTAKVAAEILARSGTLYARSRVQALIQRLRPALHS